MNENKEKIEYAMKMRKALCKAEMVDEQGMINKKYHFMLGKTEYEWHLEQNELLKDAIVNLGVGELLEDKEGPFAGCPRDELKSHLQLLLKKQDISSYIKQNWKPTLKELGIEIDDNKKKCKCVKRVREVMIKGYDQAENILA